MENDGKTARLLGPRTRDSFGRWLPGAEPGPGRGNTKSPPSVRELARAYTTEAVEALVNILRGSPEDSERRAAAQVLLADGHGAPSRMLAPMEDGAAQSALVTINRRRAELAAKAGQAATGGEGC